MNISSRFSVYVNEPMIDSRADLMDPELVPDARTHPPTGPPPAQRYLSVGRIRPWEDVDVCVASGEIDRYTIPVLRGVLREIEARGSVWVFVDLSQVAFLGVSGARELSIAGTRARVRHQWMGLVVSTRAVRRTLEVTGFDIGLPTYERLSDGLATLPDTAGNSWLCCHARTPVRSRSDD